MKWWPWIRWRRVEHELLAEIAEARRQASPDADAFLSAVLERLRAQR